MSDRLKLGLFGAALAAVFGIGAAIGAVAGPIDVGGDDHPPAVVTTTTVVTHEGGHDG